MQSPMWDIVTPETEAGLSSLISLEGPGSSALKNLQVERITGGMTASTKLLLVHVKQQS